MENPCILPLTPFSACQVIMEMNMKMTTVMMTLMKFHNVKRNLRSGCYYVASINAIMIQSHEEVNHMKTCSFIGQKPPEQCHLIYFVNLPAGSQNEETILYRTHLLEISLSMLSRPSPVLYSHSMGIPFMVRSF